VLVWSVARVVHSATPGSIPVPAFLCTVHGNRESSRLKKGRWGLDESSLSLSESGEMFGD
jgi:hypothetical protein